MYNDSVVLCIVLVDTCLHIKQVHVFSVSVITIAGMLKKRTKYWCTSCVLTFNFISKPDKLLQVLVKFLRYPIEQNVFTTKSGRCFATYVICKAIFVFVVVWFLFLVCLFVFSIKWLPHLQACVSKSGVPDVPCR